MNQLTINDINKLSFKEAIKTLPNSIRNKLFIFCITFHENTGSEGSLRVEKIENVGSSKIHPKSIAI